MWKYLTNQQYRFFKRKLYQVQASIWEAEFKTAKSRQVREGVRQDRDRAKEAMNQITAGIPTAQGDGLKKMQADLDALTDNVQRYEAQMAMVDKQINGFMGDETHEPVIGLLEQIKSYVELKLMYISYMSEL